MSRFTNQLFAAFAAVMIMAGSFSALVTVPQAQTVAIMAAPALA